MECPSKECHEDKEKMRQALFGPDGLGGLAACVKQKISWKAMIAICVFMGGFVIAGLNAWGNAKDERNENKESIAVIQNDLQYIKQTTDKIEQNQMKPSELLEAIKEAIKNKCLNF
jgi:hypothetical protein